MRLAAMAKSTSDPKANPKTYHTGAPKSGPDRIHQQSVPKGARETSSGDANLCRSQSRKKHEQHEFSSSPTRIFVEGVMPRIRAGRVGELESGRWIRGNGAISSHARAFARVRAHFPRGRGIAPPRISLAIRNCYAGAGVTEARWAFFAVGAATRACASVDARGRPPWRRALCGR
jgi:hypothetical protein